ncbi:MAG TPA: hypothetical protein VK553_11995 [Candidatus Nitrosopolaris rasttigaisensis]|nr:hypothetical protein [Candidatus Nitrosopolaris rasttigaisensis]
MSAGRISKRNNNSFVRINMPDSLVKTSSSTVGISTFDIKTTNQPIAIWINGFGEDGAWTSEGFIIFPKNQD